MDRWRTTREDKAFSRCTECLKSYTLISTSEDTSVDRCHRQSKFVCYVARDLSIAFFISQLVVIFLAWLVWQCDGTSGNGYLITLLQAEGFPQLFYYLCGLILSLALVGTLFYSQPRCCPGGCRDQCPDGGFCDGFYCTDCYFYRPFGYGYGYGGNQGGST